MDVTNISEALQTIKDENGWTQTRLAQELGVSASWVSYAIRGLHDPPIGHTAALLDRIGCEIRIRTKPEDPQESEDPEVPVERREFHGHVAAVGAASAVEAARSALFIPSPTTDPYQNAAYVRTLAEGLARDLHELGGTPSATIALRYVERLKPAITSRDRELQTAASELARQAAWTLYDAQHFTRAENIGRMALLFGKRAEDLDAQARIYPILSQICTGHGDPARGVMYAQQGLQLPDISDGNRAMLNVRLGRSLALIPGHTNESRTALDQARSADKVSPLEEANVAVNVGVALDDLRMFEAARESFHEGWRLAQCSALLQADCLGRQTQAALRAAKPSLVAHHMLTLAHVAPMVTSARLKEMISQVLKASGQWTTVPEMRHAREQLAAVAK